MPSPTTSSSASQVGQSTSLSINALIHGEKWGGSTGTGATLTYSFPWSGSETPVFAGYSGGNYSTLNEPNASSHFGLDTAQQAAARSALQSWADVANLGFSEVAETSSNVGDIRFAWTSVSSPMSDGRNPWGWARYPNLSYPSGGDVWISTLITNSAIDSWMAGSGNFEGLIHELGHTLGLKHPFEDNPVLPSSQDSRQYSMMSYTDHPHILFREVSANSDGTYSFDFHNIYPDTPMLYDIAAIQYLYGANLAYKTGNDVYTFDPAAPFIRTLWDAGGTDTISVANFTKGCSIDLRAGHFSKISIESDPLPPRYSGGTTPTYDGTDNLAIAYGCVIENAVGGSASDTLTGNEADNSLDGGSGIDVAVYSGNKADYTITRTSSGYTVSGSAALGGSDTLTNIERLQFSDLRVAIDISGNAGCTYRIYQAAFDRQPDAGGLSFWIHYMDSGCSLEQVAKEFINSTEFRNLYGTNPTTGQFITKLYNNVLHRTPEQAGFDFWVNTVNVGATSREQALMGFSESAENQANLIGVIGCGIDYTPTA